MANIKQLCTNLVTSQLEILKAQEKLAAVKKELITETVLSGMTDFFSLNMNAVYREAEQGAVWELRDRMPQRPKRLPPDERKVLTKKLRDEDY